MLNCFRLLAPPYFHVRSSRAISAKGGHFGVQHMTISTNLGGGDDLGGEKKLTFLPSLPLLL